MACFDRDVLILALKVSSTAALGLYAGSSIYINAVEVPAALDYDAEHGLMCWQKNFARASRFCVSFLLSYFQVQIMVIFSFFAILAGIRKRYARCPNFFLIATPGRDKKKLTSYKKSSKFVFFFFL